MKGEKKKKTKFMKLTTFLQDLLLKTDLKKGGKTNGNEKKKKKTNNCIDTGEKFNYLIVI